ncbi:MAG: site-2 protease family protein [Oscillospiraceae bacterium]|nr:site-2 protease family protein [Oscillospiraceae bacterium]
MYIKLKKIKIHVICLFLLLLFASINFSVYMFILFLCIFIHETGHIIFIKLNRLNIISVEILPFGINIITKKTRLTSYKTDIIINLSGPCANIICSAVILIIIKINGYNSVLFFAFLTNILYAIINLFPVKNLDGGRALEIILKIIFTENFSYVIFSVISAIFLGILSVFALFVLMITRYNFTLILLCCYLFYTIHFSTRQKEK